jgi:hypothetical protein
MRLRFTALLLGLLIAAPSGGCFVFEEIDHGLAEMDRLSPRGKEAPKVPAGSEQEKTSILAAWKEKGLGAVGFVQEKVDEALEKEPDPDNTIVSCWVEGRAHFTHKYDCQAMGGRIRSR